MSYKNFISFFTIFQLTVIVFAKGSLRKLNEENWSQMLEGEWMVEFYAPWCPACKGMQPIWEEFANWSEDLSIEVAQIDVTTNPGLSGRFMVTALPTLYHVKDGVFRQYKGSRSKDNLITFIEEKKWSTIEPISPWKAPQSIPMSFVSQFFKLSMVLRAIHTHFVDHYGLPYWGSYGIFAFGTIVCGAILGLILVCVIDFIYPPKPIEFPPKKSSKDSSDEEDSKEENVIDTKDDSDKDSSVRKRKVNKKETSGDKSS